MFNLLILIEDSLDKAYSELEPEEFDKLKEAIRAIIDSYEK